MRKCQRLLCQIHRTALVWLKYKRLTRRNGYSTVVNTSSKTRIRVNLFTWVTAICKDRYYIFKHEMRQVSIYTLQLDIIGNVQINFNDHLTYLLSVTAQI